MKFVKGFWTHEGPVKLSSEPFTVETDEEESEEY